MKIPIEIETFEGPMLAFNLFDKPKSLGAGTSIKAPGDIQVTMGLMVEHRGVDIPTVLELIIETAATIDVGLFTAWLYQKVQDPKRTKIKIREKEITFDEGEIIKAIEREIEIEQ
ncbi:hypothetical protein BMS3Bbin08_02358 [bacterium BMS3Bbin08]|nr:hypothetical protein BMS3Bbin08_02358 [bacterium BMS3Bbin08]